MFPYPDAPRRGEFAAPTRNKSYIECLECHGEDGNHALDCFNRREDSYACLFTDYTVPTEPIEAFVGPIDGRENIIQQRLSRGANQILAGIAEYLNTPQGLFEAFYAERERLNVQEG